MHTPSPLKSPRGSSFLPMHSFLNPLQMCCPQPFTNSEARNRFCSPGCQQMVPSPGEARPGRNAGLQECELAGELGTPGILRPPVLPLCLLLATWAPGPTTQAATGRVTRRKASDRPTRGWGWGGARWLGLPCVPRPRRPARPCSAGARSSGATSLRLAHFSAGWPQSV